MHTAGATAAPGGGGVYPPRMATTTPVWDRESMKGHYHIEPSQGILEEHLSRGKKGIAERKSEMKRLGFL